MTPPISIDGTDITGATIDGTDVQEITVDGDVVFSGGPTIIDNFEANLYGNIGNTLSTYYNGDTNSASLQQNNVNEGSFAVEFTGNVVELMATPHPNGQFQIGNTYRVDHLTNTAEQSFIYYGVISGTGRDDYTGYRLLLREDINQLELREGTNGSQQTISSTNIPNTIGNWVTFEVTWATPNTHTINLFDQSNSLLGSISGTGSIGTTGTGIGFGMANFGSTRSKYWDFARVV